MKVIIKLILHQNVLNFNPCYPVFNCWQLVHGRRILHQKDLLLLHGSSDLDRAFTSSKFIFSWRSTLLFKDHKLFSYIHHQLTPVLFLHCSLSVNVLNCSCDFNDSGHGCWCSGLSNIKLSVQLSLSDTDARHMLLSVTRLEEKEADRIARISVS
jgi:hypothetical protein